MRLVTRRSFLQLLGQGGAIGFLGPCHSRQQ
ncbi:twin-arginine translocation signal domain-containing protein [Myxococcus sp. MxC21-1]